MPENTESMRAGQAFLDHRCLWKTLWESVSLFQEDAAKSFFLKITIFPIFGAVRLVLSIG
jgi:hypothetical protein